MYDVNYLQSQIKISKIITLFYVERTTFQISVFKKYLSSTCSESRPIIYLMIILDTFYYHLYYYYLIFFIVIKPINTIHV